MNPSFCGSWVRLFLLVVLVGSLGACGPAASDGDGDDDDSSAADDDDAPVSFRMWSPAFEDGDLLPVAYECDQSNPEVLWEGVPDGTVALALIFDDPTAGNFPHWAIYNIPPSATGLQEATSGSNVANTPPDGSSELDNGFGWNGYLGSCPCGVSPNTYRWRLWALDGQLSDPAAGSAGAQFSALADAAEDASIERVEMSHRYGPHTGCP